MGKNTSPSARWTREHGRKIIHYTWLSAWWHAFRINHSVGAPHACFDTRRAPYECRWGQWYRDGETAPLHWHVGRPPTSHKIS